MISKNREDYLRELYKLNEKKEELNVTNLSKALKISKPSVSEMVKVLSRDKFVKYKKYDELKLTKKGFDFSKSLTIKHRVIESFLREILKLNLKEVHSEANKLEHAMGDKTILRLRKFLKSPKYDPHGKEIPF